MIGRDLLRLASATTVVLAAHAVAGCRDTVFIYVHDDAQLDDGGIRPSSLDGAVVLDAASGPDAGNGADAAPDLDADLDAAAPVDASAIDAGSDAGPSCAWELASDGLSGGAMSVVERDPRHAGVVFATSGTRVFRSADDGASWETWTDLDVAPTALAFPADDPGAVLLGCGDGVRRSVDGGRTFDPFALDGLPITALTVHPTESDLLLASISALGVLRSTDGGMTWSPGSRGLPSAAYVNRISPDPRDADAFLAVAITTNAAGGWTDEGRVLRSIDSGLTWTELTSSIGRPHELRRCEADPDRVWLVTMRGVFVSSDGGESFELRAFGGERPLSVDVSGEACERVGIFVTAPVEHFGVHLSFDGGETIVGPFDTGLDVSRAVRSPPVLRWSGASNLLVGTHTGLFVSEDVGASYHAVSGLRAIPTRVVTERAGHLWITTWGTGVWHLGPSAAAWERLPVASFFDDYAYGVQPLEDDVTIDQGPMVLGDWGLIYHRGETGSALSASVGGQYNAFSFAELASGRILATTQLHGMLRSDDRGASFVDSNDGIAPWETPFGSYRDFRSVAVDPAHPSVVLAGSALAGIWRSEDEGASWVQTDLTDKVVTSIVALGTADAGRFVASTDAHGLFVSEDGLHWSALNDGLPSLSTSALEAAPDGAALVSSDRGVYRLAPGATTWEPFDAFCAPDSLGLARVVERADGRWVYAVDIAGQGFYRHPY